MILGLAIAAAANARDPGERRRTVIDDIEGRHVQAEVDREAAKQIVGWGSLFTPLSLCGEHVLIHLLESSLLGGGFYCTSGPFGVGVGEVTAFTYGGGPFGEGGGDERLFVLVDPIVDQAVEHRFHQTHHAGYAIHVHLALGHRFEQFPEPGKERPFKHTLGGQRLGHGVWDLLFARTDA